MSRDDLRRGNAFATTLAYQKRLDSKTSKLDCIGVGQGKDGCIYIYCKDCGATFRKTKSKLRPSNTNRIICPYCEDMYIKLREREELLEKQKQIALRQEEIVQRRLAMKRRVCKNCGKEFQSSQSNHTYCSELCRRRFTNRQHDITRRMRIRDNLIDKDISLIKLAKRDKGICWICHKQVDWNDFEKRDDGVFIVGNNHPSIDHVIALANGGKHSWENVRLAHCKCNTEKSDKLIGENPSGQLVLFL